MYGSMRLGKELWYWDYVADKACPATEMPLGSERWKASERRKAELMRAADRAEEVKP
jgi:hypothetical protein